ncbi:ion transporter [Haloferax sp. YSSS75]|uniref:ion transporter n=1 Tax=Haloferax sp. YSSS75 TaxID=3388564 RepID=UPI00398CD643
MSSPTKRRAWRVVDPDAKSRRGQHLETVALVLASLNVVAVVIQSVAPIYEAVPLLFDVFGHVSVFLFTLLYVVRLWAVPATDRQQETTDRLRFARRPFVLLDFVVIVGYWFGVAFVPGSLGWIRVLWLARMFNLPQLKRSRMRFRRVLAAQRDDLSIAFIGSGTIALLASTLMYFVENSTQPEAFSSIPAALWWAIVTLTTVGYGDVVPGTPLGRFLGAITTFGGVAFFALPSSILAAGFMDERARERQASDELADTGGESAHTNGEQLQNRCPHCGEALDSTETTNH